MVLPTEHLSSTVVFAIPASLYLELARASPRLGGPKIINVRASCICSREPACTLCAVSGPLRLPAQDARTFMSHLRPQLHHSQSWTLKATCLQYWCTPRPSMCPITKLCLLLEAHSCKQPTSTHKEASCKSTKRAWRPQLAPRSRNHCGKSLSAWQCVDTIRVRRTKCSFEHLHHSSRRTTVSVAAVRSAPM